MRCSTRWLPTPSQAAVAMLLAALFVAVPTTAAETSPWATLDRLRGSLVEGGPTKAEFTQTYVPAGFSSGETERGTMFLELPECMRWDYSEPYRKSFLLCGDTAYYWNPEDGAGRRYEVDREAEPGLDLLMLSTETLRERYRATAEEGETGRVRVTLEPLDGTGSLAEATLTVDPEAGRLTALAYRDREGNRTTFEVAEPLRLESAGNLFAPPADVRWETGSP